jgi:hypothetical protein
MSVKSASISLNQGIIRKTFTAEVTGPLDQPLKNIDVIFSLSGGGSLATDCHVDNVGACTDGIGHARVSVSRLSDEQGDVAACLEVRCADDAARIQLKLLSVAREPALT